MAGIYGADIVQLRALSKQLGASSARLAGAKGSLSGNLRGSTAWKGPDADRFRSDWEGTHSALLAKVIEALAAAGKAVAAHAEEQEKASGAGGQGGVTGGLANGTGTFEQLRNRADHSVPRHPDQGQADLTGEELKRLQDLVRDAGENNDLFEGNDTDVNELRDALAALKPAQLDQFLKTLSDDELKQLAGGSGSDGKGLFNWEGTTPFEKHQLLDQLLSKASPEQVDRLKELIPWAQPNGEARGDAARPGGADPSTTNQWMEPTSPVIGEQPGKDDIRQGQYGDCVVMAAAGAMINADPGWARDHVTDNGNGTVSVRLFDKNGNEQWVTVTKDLPENSHGGQLGAKPGQNGNWPAYIEKALSQVYTEDDNRDPTKDGAPRDIADPPGNYRAIEGNYGPDAFRYLAGPDVEQTSDANVLWSAANEGRPSLVGTLGETPEGAPDGYSSGHAYFVTGTDGDGNIVLQNPWGPDHPKMSISKTEFTKFFQNATVTR
jgi:hypothetical protein